MFNAISFYKANNVMILDDLTSDTLNYFINWNTGHSVMLWSDQTAKFEEIPAKAF